MASTSTSTSIVSKKYIAHLHHNNSSCSPFDAQVLAVKYPHVFTSPNTTFVPEPYIFDVVDLQPLADGRFGHIDCFLWPQLYSRKHWWSGCIFQHEQFVEDDVMKWLWFTPTETDARQEPGCAFELGLLEKKLCNAFKKLFNKAAGCVVDAQKSVRADAQKELAMDMILQVAESQCILLDTFAIVQYETIALPSQPSSDQFRLSDKTFLLKTNIHLIQEFVPPPSYIVTRHAKVQGELALFPVLYRGTSGEHHQLFTCQLARVHGETYVRQHLPCESYQGMAPSIIPPNNNASASCILPSFQRESKFASDMGSAKTKHGGAVRTAPSQPCFSPYQVPPPIDPLTSLATWHTLTPALDPFSNPPSLSSVASTPVPITKVKGNRKPKLTFKQSEVAASSQG
ncbi:hypothetical protein K503DRAFT_805808 [Rhizopogon vinicolor AM-OR11-026]|uniref:Uncharacterized protein n=1 Tax=Rhizopogon vinicolor AM-OR11-026 TaxID=1314800 RepID=A0A1B7MGP1_9AGAM|nr:hypothetical protein K503DRAFT_805808 [Rhizopogon vinicolor AM-OR11-026]